MTTDDFEFADELEIIETANNQMRWNLLVVDDDHDVHSVTKMALSGFTVKDQGINIWDAYSGTQAVEMLENGTTHPDLVLMDVVMESPTAGLDAVKSIRENLGLNDIPVILVRTGQPAHLSHDDLFNNPQIDGVLLKNESNATLLRQTIERGLVDGRNGLKNHSLRFER